MPRRLKKSSLLVCCSDNNRFRDFLRRNPPGMTVEECESILAEDPEPMNKLYQRIRKWVDHRGEIDDK